MTAVTVLVGAVMVVVMIPVSLFLVRYWRGSPWRATVTGRALMLAMGTLDVLLAIAAVRIFFGDSTPLEIVRLVMLLGLGLAAWRLYVQLYRVQRATRAAGEDTALPIDV